MIFWTNLIQSLRCILWIIFIENVSHRIFSPKFLFHYVYCQCNSLSTFHSLWVIMRTQSRVLSEFKTLLSTFSCIATRTYTHCRTITIASIRNRIINPFTEHSTISSVGIFLTHFLDALSKLLWSRISVL